MTIHTETTLRSFQFWAGAADNAKYLWLVQLDTIEEILENIYPNGIEDTQLNDLMWFDTEMIAEWLGYKTFEDLIEASVPWDQFTKTLQIYLYDIIFSYMRTKFSLQKSASNNWL